MADTQPKANKPGILGSMSRFTPREFRRITKEMYAQNLELVQVNSTLSLLNSIDRIVLQSTSSIKEACVKMTGSMVEEYGACAVAAIFCRSDKSTSSETLEAWSCDWPQEVDRDAVGRFVEALHPSPSYNWGEMKTLYVKDAAVFGKVMGSSPTDTKDFLKQLALGRFYLAKLVGSNGVIGTLMIGLQNENVQHDSSKLLGRVSEAVSIALDNKLLQEENERILFRLQASNAKLRKLDQTKDDFISMASHQLRTPLTSVKGYVSMVLDGDAGQISALQRKLLTQSFISSQRMTYLIADLLNVSRLRTGKFIIEPISCDLATVVQDEVKQLIETAKGRNLELAYAKPEEFPLFMLDETKLRQVIMNFIDNAIYYTPSGGHIVVELKDKPETIELLVTDDGIGVPRSEQHHLFSKFYRAPNAKRARPDGTGLGLFMAKKVIIAQGGAIIFKSTENKGSTFGFSFSKSRLTRALAKAAKKRNAVSVSAK
jgi:signal transduction histidine kinase